MTQEEEEFYTYLSENGNCLPYGCDTCIFTSYTSKTGCKYPVLPRRINKAKQILERQQKLDEIKRL